MVKLYKHHNTVKYLIGICPQGAVTFISKGWGGWVSDVHLTENCHINLENLLAGDVIIADRGFNVHDSAGIYCAEVKFPSFIRGKKQLGKAEVDSSWQLSRVWIHVERAIGAVYERTMILSNWTIVWTKINMFFWSCVVCNSFSLTQCCLCLCLISSYKYVCTNLKDESFFGDSWQKTKLHWRSHRDSRARCQQVE